MRARCVWAAASRVPEPDSVCCCTPSPAAQQKLTGHVAKSTEIMKMMNKLTKVSQIAEVMQGMQKEMCKVRALARASGPTARQPQSAR